MLVGDERLARGLVNDCDYASATCPGSSDALLRPTSLYYSLCLLQYLMMVCTATRRAPPQLGPTLPNVGKGCVRVQQLQFGKEWNRAYSIGHQSTYGMAAEP